MYAARFAGDLIQLIDLADKTTGAPPQAEAPKGEKDAPAKPQYTFAGTLQHVANRFCTERSKAYGNGAIFCNELVALQHKWIDASQLGEIKPFTQLLGTMTGHFCPTKEATGDARCLVLSLLTRAVPTELNWNADRKRYLQMTKDVAAHYCDKHGENDLVCPLMRALNTHYYHAVMTKEADKYVEFVQKMNKHYCSNGPETHPADDRCSILPLLLKAMPEMSEKSPDGEVLVDRHALPNSGDVPPIDDGMMMQVDIAMENEKHAKTTGKKKKPTAQNAEYKAREFNPDHLSANGFDTPSQP